MDSSDSSEGVQLCPPEGLRQSSEEDKARLFREIAVLLTRDLTDADLPGIGSLIDDLPPRAPWSEDEQTEVIETIESLTPPGRRAARNVLSLYCAIFLEGENAPPQP